MALTEEDRIDRVRRLYELLNAGDFDDTMELAHPEIVLVRIGAQGELRGPDALRGWLEPDAFASQQLEPLEFECIDHRVLVQLHIHARGAGSGIEIEIDAWTVYTFDEDGLITRVEIFPDHEEEQARRALLG
jgi:ketosteroid isomerase-like protein